MNYKPVIFIILHSPFIFYESIWIDVPYPLFHYCDVIMNTIASQITSLTIVYLTVNSGTHKKHQSSASLAFVRGIHRRPVNSLHKGPVTRKMFPFDDVIMCLHPDHSRHRRPVILTTGRGDLATGQSVDTLLGICIISHCHNQFLSNFEMKLEATIFSYSSSIFFHSVYIKYTTIECHGY